MKEHFDVTQESPADHTTALDMNIIPWPGFYGRVAASLTWGEQKYQMIVTDSQRLGAFVEGGYYLNLTDRINSDPELATAARVWRDFAESSEGYYRGGYKCIRQGWDAA